MNMKIISAGPLTTVQDRGRFGYMRYGITTSGVMDERAYDYGNYLVGNTGGEACLEMTLKGVSVEFVGNGVIAFTGADMSPVLNGVSVQTGEAIEVTDGDLLEFGFAGKGLRTYFFCRGGIEVPVVYGSRSTNLKCEFGGFYGRKLMNGDVLETGTCVEGQQLAKGKKQINGNLKTDGQSWRKGKHQPQNDMITSYQLPEEPCMTIRVLLGPQDDYFTDKGIHSLLTSEYKISPESDRMGIRLQGESLESRHGMDIISDAIPFGSIQVSADGQPIILMADRQTTGGYAKIATVISDDIWKLAQARPGTYLHFQKVTERRMII